jgi:protein-L-isoaspartate(D-aspartate) O-methyltransferase
MVDVLASRGIHDETVLAAMGRVPRERFVPERHRAHAYADSPLSIGHRATISQPYVVARMLELARLGPRDRVLDVGTGSGYAAAVAAEVVAEVVTVERVAALSARAEEVLADLGYDHVTVVTGDGAEGWEDRAPYDAILVAAATATVPEALTAQLADGGRLVLPLGQPGGSQQLVVVERRGDELVREVDAGVRFVPLLGGTTED